MNQLLIEVIRKSEEKSPGTLVAVIFSILRLHVNLS